MRRPGTFSCLSEWDKWVMGFVSYHKNQTQTTPVEGEPDPFLQTWAPSFIFVLNIAIPFFWVLRVQGCSYLQTLHRTRPPPDDPQQMSGLWWGICPSSGVYIYERIIIGPLPPATSDPIYPHMLLAREWWSCAPLMNPLNTHDEKVKAVCF